MKKYFYTDGTGNFGPFTLEELRDENLARETPVWFHELGEWKSAGSIPELTELFKMTPPPPPGSTPVTPGVPKFDFNQKPPKSWLLESVLATVLCCLPFGVIGIVYASKVETRFYSGDLEGAIRASKNAETWTYVSFFTGLVAFVVSMGIAFAVMQSHGRFPGCY